jgi:hypothetical protein
MSQRVSGLTWALICCPLMGWAAALYAERVTPPHALSSLHFLLLMTILPAAMASAGNALLGRDFGAVLRSGIFAASVCVGGLLLLVLAVLLTFHPQ